MKKKESTLQVDWTKDKLGIKDNVIGFANILKQEKYTPDGASKVYSISAEFGIGKTFFCERLRDVLEQDNIPVSLLNIWEMDFYENPLIPLLIKIKEVYVEHNKIQNIAEKSNETVLNVAKETAKNVIKHRYGIDIDKFIRLYKNLKPSESDIYNDYQEFYEELSTLKEHLSAWAKEENKPIIIIIDELDRCRPDYAVKTLEILKHFFDIPGFVFVLAIDEKQLQSSVETLFGTKNFDGYKRKFINNSFILPTPNRANFTNFLYEQSGLANIVEQIEKQEKDLVFKIRRNNYQDFVNRCYFGEDNIREINNCKKYNELQTIESIIKRYFTAYSTWFRFNLRQMEQIFDRLVLFAKQILSNNTLFSPDLAVFLICLHEFNLDIYSKLKDKTSLGYSEHLFSTILGSNTSIAHQLYDKAAFEICEKSIDRNIVPECPKIPDFSTLDNENNQRVIIYDNVERFFIRDSDNELKWLLDATVNKNPNPIDNKCRIGIIMNSNQETQWNEPIPNIDTASDFDLESFVKDYFNKVDFISMFNNK